MSRPHRPASGLLSSPLQSADESGAHHAELSRWQERLIAGALLLLMIATRFHHLGSAVLLPDASWAIFFAGGFYLVRWGYLGLFLAAAALIDYLAITRFGVSSYCISAGYVWLVPAYGALWAGGLWYRRGFHYDGRSLLRLLASSVLATAACFVLSNLGFALYSRNVPSQSLVSYFQQVAHYFPGFLMATLGYLAFFALLHLLVTVLHGKAVQRRLSAR